jgi:hypothetical protein
MRKKDLIKMLESIPGNPDVMLWNGIALDVVPIEKRVEKVALVRDEKEYFTWLMEREGATPEEIKKGLRTREWHLNEYMAREAKKEDIKTIYVLQAKHTGKQHWDRLGTMEY